MRSDPHCSRAGYVFFLSENRGKLGQLFKNIFHSRPGLTLRLISIGPLMTIALLLPVGCSKSKNQTQGKRQIQSDSIYSTLASRPLLQEGYVVYRKYGCILCHGVNGEKGIKNNNAQTGEEVPALTYVAEGYTHEELKQQILKGLVDIPKKDSLGRTPPYRMPSWTGVINDKELECLTAYLLSLMPEEEKEKW